MAVVNYGGGPTDSADASEVMPRREPDARSSRGAKQRRAGGQRASAGPERPGRRRLPPAARREAGRVRDDGDPVADRAGGAEQAARDQAAEAKPRRADHGGYRERPVLRAFAGHVGDQREQGAV